MQKIASELIGASVFSIHAGQKLGEVSAILIRDKDLKVELFEVEITNSPMPHYLLSSDIRACDKSRLIINSDQELSQTEELLRHQEFIKQGIKLFDAKVITQSGKNLGRVKDYSINTTHYFVTKLHVRAGWLQRIMHERLIIDRADIVDVTKNKITVRDATVKAETATKVLPAKV